MGTSKKKAAREVDKKEIRKKLTPFEILKNIFWFLCVCAVGFGIFFLIAQIGVYNKNKELEQIKTNEGIADGIVIKTGSMKGSYAIVEYYFNGVRYEKQESSYSDDVEEGQRFKVKFDKTNPSVSKIMYEETFFNTDDKTNTTTGKIVQVDGYTVRFEYEVENNKRKKFQKYPEGKKFEEGEVYTVEYLIKNPRVAILKIN